MEVLLLSDSREELSPCSFSLDSSMHPLKALGLPFIVLLRILGAMEVLENMLSLPERVLLSNVEVKSMFDVAAVLEVLAKETLP